MIAPARSRHGFVLAELIVVLIISSVVVAALLAGLIALIRGLQPQGVTIAGETLPIAPTFGAFPSAVRLHQTFTEHAASARAVYVFGGTHLSIPSGAPPTTLRPLKAQTLPIIADFNRSLPMDTKGFYDQYADDLGELETAGSQDDFSVVTIEWINGTLAISCLVQVRRRDVSLQDDAVTTPYVVREVKLWDVGAAQPQRYVYAEKPNQNARVFIGAVHTWMRYQAAEGQNEEGPACVIFPDPWVYAGTRGQIDDIPAFSRFSYFLAVSP